MEYLLTVRARQHLYTFVKNQKKQRPNQEQWQQRISNLEHEIVISIAVGKYSIEDVSDIIGTEFENNPDSLEDIIELYVLADYGDHIPNPLLDLYYEKLELSSQVPMFFAKQATTIVDISQNLINKGALCTQAFTAIDGLVLDTDFMTPDEMNDLSEVQSLMDYLANLFVQLSNVIDLQLSKVEQLTRLLEISQISYNVDFLKENQCASDLEKNTKELNALNEKISDLINGFEKRMTMVENIRSRSLASV